MGGMPIPNLSFADSGPVTSGQSDFGGSHIGGSPVTIHKPNDNMLLYGLLAVAAVVIIKKV